MMNLIKNEHRRFATNSKTKRLMLGCLSALILSLLFSCEQSELTEKESTTEVVLPPLNYGKLVILGATDYHDDVYTLNFETKDSIQKINYDSLHFQVEHATNLPSITQIKNSPHRAIPIFALPGDTLRLEFDLIDFLNERHTHRFFGKRAYENRALNALNEVLIYDNPVHNSQFELDEAAFLSKMDSVKRVGTSIFEAYHKKRRLSPYFAKSYFTFLDYKIYEFLAKYLRLKPRAIEDEAEVFNELKRRMKTYYVEDTALIEVYPYFNYLKNHFYQKTEDLKSPVLKFMEIDSIYANRQIRNLLKYSVLNNELSVLSRYKEIRTRYRPKKENPVTIQRSRFDLKRPDYLPEYMELYRNSNPPEKYALQIEKSFEELMKD